MRFFSLLIMLFLLTSVASSQPLDGLKQRLQNEKIPVAMSGSEVSDEKETLPPEADDSQILEQLLVKIRELAPGIDSLETNSVIESPQDGTTEEPDRKERLIAERQQDIRKRLSQAIGTYQAGSFQTALQALETIYKDYPYWMKTVYFTILCHREMKHTDRSIAIARELVDLLQCRVSRQALGQSLEVELAAMADRTDEVTLTAMQRKRYAEKLDGIFARLKKLRPDLADLPHKRKKPVPEGESHSYFLKRMIRFYNAREVRSALVKAGKDLAAGRKTAAYERYAATYQEHPGSFRALYGMAVSQRQDGNLQEAVKLAANLLKRMRVRSGSKEEREELNEALGLEDDEVGKRPGDKPDSEPTNPGGGSTFRIASFNIFHGTDKEWEARLFRSTKVLLDNQVDIAGLQEVRENQMKRFMKADLGGHRYAIYPPRFKGHKEGFVSENSIIWNKERFELVSSKEVPFMYFGNAKRKLPQLKLRDRNTGQLFYVLNTHDPAFPENAAKRLQNANFYAQYLDNLAKEGLPIFFTGDFNSGYKVRLPPRGNTTLNNERKNLTYCILTRNGKFWDAWDASRNKRGEGPSTDNANSVDHIFMSSNVQVTKYFKSEDGKKKNGSDVHDTIIAQVKIPK